MNGRRQDDQTALARSVPSKHDFVGLHLVANYTHCCPQAIGDNAGIRQAMVEATRASGATVLNIAQHVFPEGGLTLVLLLSESHASIHTYPEFQSCFIDLFTCGTSCRPEKFEAVIRAFLAPGQVSRRIFARHQDIEMHERNAAAKILRESGLSLARNQRKEC